MTDIWLIRHGQACFGTSDYDRLSPTGKRQAELLGRYLKATEIRFDSVYSGTLKRQRQTARLVTGCETTGLDPALDEYDAETLFKERFPAEARRLGLPVSMESVWTRPGLFQAVFSRIMNQWVTGELDVQGVQSYERHQKCLWRALQRIVKESEPGQRIGLFTSGGVISMILQRCLELSPVKALALCWRIKNTSITRVSAQRPQNGPGEKGKLGLELTEFNTLAHLAAEKEEGLITFR